MLDYSGASVLLAYGVLMILGGLMGYRAGSRASLIAGAGGGVALVGAWLLAQYYLRPGLWVGFAITLVMTVALGRRWRVTKKFMPAGMLVIVSAVVLVALVYFLSPRSLVP